VSSDMGTELGQLDTDAPKADGSRFVTAPQLMLMTFFCTTGGPFGIESAVAAGGPAYAIIGTLIILLFWALPQALMAAELSLMMNENGGGVIWVAHAFGDFIGYVNAHASLLNSLASQGILIILFVQYVQVAVTVTLFEAWGLRIAFVAFVTLINIWGLT